MLYCYGFRGILINFCRVVLLLSLGSIMWIFSRLVEKGVVLNWCLSYWF